MRRLLGLILLGMANGVVAQEKPSVQEKVPTVTAERPMSFWMAQKIEHSKKILEALTKEDFASVEAEANHLRRIGKIEGFVRRQDPIYTRHQQSFNSSLIEVAAQAKEKNVEGAVLAFNQLTTSCIACHKILRAVPTETPSVKGEAVKSDTLKGDAVRE